jgi:thiol-disulfide isomerase/thioredoxin
MRKLLFAALLWVLVITAGCSIPSGGSVSLAPAVGPSPVSPTVASPTAAGPTQAPATETAPVLPTATATRVMPVATATAMVAATDTRVLPTPTLEPSPTPVEVIAVATNIDAVARPTTGAGAEPVAATTQVTPTTPVFAFFFADWCAVCKQMRPTIDSLKGQYADRIKFAYINVDDPQGKQAAATYRVWAIPYFVLLKPSGEVVGQWVGQQADTVFPTAFDDLLKSAGS